MAGAKSFVHFQGIRYDVIGRLKSYKHVWSSGFRYGLRYVHVSSLLLLQKVLLLERDEIDLKKYFNINILTLYMFLDIMFRRYVKDHMYESIVSHC